MKFAVIILFELSLYTVQSDLIIDCHPDKNPTLDRCLARKCYWQPTPSPSVPKCVFRDNVGYNLQQKYNWTRNVLTGRLKRIKTPTLFGNDFDRLRVEIRSIFEDTFHVLIQDLHGTVAGVPHFHIQQILSSQSRKIYNNDKLDYVFDKTPFGFAFSRKSTGKIIFDTRKIPGLTFSEQFVQISIKVPSQYVYGLGETSYTKLKHDFQWRKWGFFAQDQGPHVSNENLYGVHPFYLCIEDESGNSHGVLFLNSHALDVFLQPEPDIITFRAIGGNLEFFIFAGPSPVEVVEQYTTVVGRPNMPPQWALGFQLSRFGYRNLTDLRKVFDRNRLAGIPQDVQFIDDDYMYHALDFTVDPVKFEGLADFVKEIHARHMKLVLLLDPAIASQPPMSNYTPLTLGLQKDVFIKDNRTGKPLEGKVWPGKTYWPDFSNNVTREYWYQLLFNFNKKVEFDGIWIDMNEPSNFGDGSTTGCATNKYNSPPYNPLIYDIITNKTICLDADQFLGKHYLLHNLYGYFETEATYSALGDIFYNKRPFILSRSTFVGSGKFTNHWTGDNRSKWDHMRYSIISVLLFQMFGIPMTGSDICGFFGEATEELCLRWSQLGAFYPYSRNHNDYDSKQDQDPAAWPMLTANRIKKVLLLRYKFLPYLYTLFYHAHTEGQPVARPLFFAFPEDLTSRIIDDQFLWGDNLMIAPILEPNSTTRYAYFPNGKWYDLDSFENIGNSSLSRNITIDSVNREMCLFLRSGTIVPFQTAATTTFETRRNNFGLYVSFQNGIAKGDLFVDDGESQPDPDSGLYRWSTYTTFDGWTNIERNGVGVINITVHRQNYKIEPRLSRIYILDIAPPKIVKIDDRELSKKQVFVGWVNKYVKLRYLSLDLNVNHLIYWE